MKYCTYCGAEIHGLQDRCPSCGAPCTDMTGVPDFRDFFGKKDAPTSLAGWCGWILLCCILPVVGACITVAGSRDNAVKNFAKAWLILTLAAILLMIAGIFALLVLRFANYYIF